MSNSMRHLAWLEEAEEREDWPDEEGQPDGDWRQVTKVHFSIRSRQGADTDADAQIDNVLVHDVRTRYREEIKPGMRLNWGGRLLNIVGAPIDADQKKRFYNLTCEELVE